jgi:hypothetical protein
VTRAPKTMVAAGQPCFPQPCPFLALGDTRGASRLAFRVIRCAAQNAAQKIPTVRNSATGAQHRFRCNVPRVGR